MKSKLQMEIQNTIQKKINSSNLNVYNVYFSRVKVLLMLLYTIS